jgi:hypothetical protein
MINKISDKEDTISGLIASINKAIEEMNKVIDWVHQYVAEQTSKKKYTRKWDVFIEYGILYVVLLVSLTAALGFIAVVEEGVAKIVIDGIGILKIAFSLSTCILLGLVKDIYWKKVQSRDDELETTKTLLDATKNALSSLSWKETITQSRFIKLLEIIRKKDPEFKVEQIYEHDLEMPQPVQSIEDLLKKVEKKTVGGRSTISLNDPS